MNINVRLQNSSVLMEYNKLRELQQQYQQNQQICSQPCFQSNVNGHIEENGVNSSSQMQFKSSFVRTPQSLNFLPQCAHKMSSF